MIVDDDMTEGSSDDGGRAVAVTRKWATPTATARIGLLVAAGVVLVGAALWAGSVGPWVGRPVAKQGRVDLPTVTNLPTPPTLPTVRPPQGRASASSWDPSAVLYALGFVLLLALLLMVAALLRSRGRAVATTRPAAAESAKVDRLLPTPDADRPFDAREAADYVIACWEQLEGQAAQRGRGRRAEQTPTEFLDGLRNIYPIETQASAELLSLYQRARFDHVRLLPDTAVRARACVDVVLAGLSSSLAGP